MGKIQRGRKAATPEVKADLGASFNIDNVPADIRQPLLEDTRALRDGLIQIANTLLDAGEKFTRWKERLPHGEYLPWVATTGYSESSALNARNVYARFKATPLLFSDLDLALPETAIVNLSTAPETATEEVVDRISVGEHLDLKTVNSIIKVHKAAYAEGKAPRPARSASGDVGADALRRMAKSAASELADATEGRLARLLHFIVDAEDSQPTKHKHSLKDLERVIRPQAQWLTEALEQLTQRRADSVVKLLHETSLPRPLHEPGPWADAATFLRDIAHSSGWERIKAPDVPELLQRGRRVLEAVVPREKHRSFTQY